MSFATRITFPVLFISCLGIALVASLAQAEIVTIDATIKAVDTEDRSITITKASKSKSNDIELEVSRKAKIVIDGKAVTLDEIEPGQKVSISYDDKLDFATAISVRGSDAKDDDVTARDMKAIQGEWLCIASDEIGKTQDKEVVKHHDRRVTIMGNSFTMKRTIDGKRGAYSGKCEIDASTGHFDFIGKGPQGAVVEWTGIFEQKGDILKLCYRYKKTGDVVRPTKFKTDENKPNISVFYTFKREASTEPSAPSNNPPLHNQHLVSEIPCADPHVFNDGSDWYIFGTGPRPYFLQGTELGQGKMRQVFLDLDYTGFAVKVVGIWGFVVHRYSDETFHAYGTLHLGKMHTVIGYFQPQPTESWEKGKPITRWKLKKILVGDVSQQDWKYYETKILEDTDKTIYLMYVANTGTDNCIFAQKMRSASEIDNSVPRRLLLKPEDYRSEDRNDPGGMQLVEGGSVFRWKGKYILLYSVGDYLLNKYKLGMAFSDSLIPAKGHTYQKVKLPDPKHTWGDSGHHDEIGYLLQTEKPHWPNYAGGLVIGPGLGSIVEIDHKHWLFFHGYLPGSTERKDRFVFRLPVTIAVAGGQPNLQWLHAALPTERSLGRF